MKSEKHVKKKSPTGVVSVKNGAKPAHDQTTQDSKAEPSVDAPAPVSVEESAKPAAPKKSSAPPKPAKNSKSVAPVKAAKPSKIEKKPLNFKVGVDFRREFKTYASTHDLKLNRLLELAFESYRKKHGD